MLRYIATGRASLLVLALLSIAASADTMRLRNGGTLEGIISEDGDEYVVEVPFGTMRLGKEFVASIEKGGTPLAEHKRQVAALADDDADGWVKLGRWAQANRLPTLAEEDFRRAIEANPSHEAARKALGQELVGGNWLTRDEAMAARGMLRVKGKWVSKEEADLMKALAEANALESEARAAEARARYEEARTAALREQALQRQVSRRRSSYDGYGGYSPIRYRSVPSYAGTYAYPYAPNNHGGTPYHEASDGHAVTIEQSGANTWWVHHSADRSNDQHSTIHRSDDGHIVEGQVANGQQRQIHRTAPNTDPSITLQHR